MSGFLDYVKEKLGPKRYIPILPPPVEPINPNKTREQLPPTNALGIKPELNIPIPAVPSDILPGLPRPPEPAAAVARGSALADLPYPQLGGGAPAAPAAPPVRYAGGQPIAPNPAELRILEKKAVADDGGFLRGGDNPNVPDNPGGTTLPNTVMARAAVPAGGSNGGGGFMTAQSPAAPMAAQGTPNAPQKYTGGILGMLGIGDPSAPGMDKPITGQISDFLGGNSFAAATKGLGFLAQASQSKPAVAAPAPMLPAPEAHTPDVSELSLLRKKRMVG